MNKSMVVAALGAALLASVVLSGRTTQAGDAAKGQVVVVHLSKYAADLHAVSMALKLASGMQEKGASVSLFVDLEGVRLVDKRQPVDMAWGHGKPVGELYDHFVKAGGKAIVCPHCAHAVGLGKDSLRPGATIPEDSQVIETLLNADKVLDY